MPLYVYQCKVCGHELEVIRKLSEMDDLDTLECPNCSGTGPKELERVTHPGCNMRPAAWF